MFIDDLIINAKNRWYLRKESGTSQMEQSDLGAEHRMESGDHLVEVLGTVIIAIFLLVVFKDKIVSAFKTNLDNAAGQLNGLFSG